MRAAALLITAAAGSLLLVASASARRAGQVDAAPDDFGALLDVSPLIDQASAAYARATEAPASVPQSLADANVAAWLAMIRQAEGTAGQADPYRVCYGYRHRIADLADHPAITGEWTGERLSDGMCQRAGYGPGCVSTAAGAYQIKRATWQRARRALNLPDFYPASQDAAAVWLTAQRGALADVQAGRLADAVTKCGNEWASLPGNAYGQGTRTLDQLAAWFANHGGNLA